MIKHMIGEEIIIQKGFEIENALSDNRLQVKIGDKGYIDGSGFIHYITGAARGKMQKVSDVVLEGYDCENIAKLVFQRLNNHFNIKEFLDDYEIDKKYFIDEIECALSDIL